jgi:hypothetical protein
MGGTQTTMNIRISYFPGRRDNKSKWRFFSPAVNRWRHQYLNKYELVRIIITN